MKYYINGKTYNGDEAYLAFDLNRGSYMETVVEDENDNRYLVTWDILPEYLDDDGNILAEDLDICNWDSPASFEEV